MINANEASKGFPTLVTPKQLAAELGLPMGGLRSWLFDRKNNRLDLAVYQVGRKLFINKEAFLSWIASHNCAKEG